ncbi:hypothetical protein GCM10009665_31050 [Kitasatospora nipponensis]|uniref:Uncharacterized protein n=1 Tax=Kitasatospora nipponensis TaxID=258049 RepID=A0ABN1WB64_9ACTN
METIPLDRGDPRWVFPQLPDGDAVAVSAALAEADAHLRTLADRLGAPPGGRLAFHAQPQFAIAGLFGVVEAAGVHFSAGLYAPRRCAFDLRWGPPWTVDTEIMGLCPPADTCGTHVLATHDTQHPTPREAAHALTEATARLLALATATPLATWHSRIDTPCPAGEGAGQGAG